MKRNTLLQTSLKKVNLNADALKQGDRVAMGKVSEVKVGFRSSWEWDGFDLLQEGFVLLARMASR